MNVIMDPLGDIMELRLLQRKFLMLDYIGPPPTPHLNTTPYSKKHRGLCTNVSKWAEAEALPTNDVRIVVKFLKKLFSHFGILKALISDRGTHLCNRQMEKILKKYGVHHRIAIAYHPQTSGQVENTNRALKRIFKKTVKDNPSIWSRKLDDALWAFRTAYKTLIGTTPNFIVNGHRVKLYHDEEQLNELTTEEIHLICEEGRMKAIPFMAQFPSNYRKTIPWASEKPYIYSVVENTCNEAKLYDLDKTGMG
ncbi:reverse transcriptase domain-containing protein [Tanacetum coccineum]